MKRDDILSAATWPMGATTRHGERRPGCHLPARVRGGRPRLVVAGSRGSFAVPASAISDHHLDVTFPSRDDHVRLSGWLFRADHPTGRSVILVHGWQGDREDVDFVALTRHLLPAATTS
jgi:hypothetical protein